MKRLAVILVALASAAVLVVLGTGASNDDQPYKLRAIFDSAFSVIKGEDVKIAGVKVGKIEKLEVTPDNKAAIVLSIDKPGFTNFRADASCRIRPQSLIGEKFVECTPTQPRSPGTAVPPLLGEVKSVSGKGQHLLPLKNNQRVVDLDLLNNIMRLPFRERFSILLNEFGAGLAGNGRALNAAIRRADPALLETDKVLKILADQNKVLADLARNGDTVLAPLAERRRQVADFVVKAGDVAQATAERDADLERTLQLLPRLLSELRPTMVRLGAFSDEASPVLEDLGSEAPALSRFAKALGPFSQASIPAVRSLGAASDVGLAAVPKTLPITKETRALAQAAKPVASNLRATLESVRDTGGLERLLDYIFFQGTAINGFDSIGHYLRAALIVNTCTTYATTPVPGCAAKYDSSSASTRAHAATAPTGDKSLDDMNKIFARIAAGEKPADAARAVLGTRAGAATEGTTAKKTRTKARRRRHHARTRATKKAATAPSTPLQIPGSVLPGAPPAATPAPQPTGSAQQPSGAAGTLLDYLLGGDA